MDRIILIVLLMLMHTGCESIPAGGTRNDHGIEEFELQDLTPAQRHQLEQIDKAIEALEEIERLLDEHEGSKHRASN